MFLIVYLGSDHGAWRWRLMRCRGRPTALPAGVRCPATYTRGGDGSTAAAGQHQRVQTPHTALGAGDLLQLFLISNLQFAASFTSISYPIAFILIEKSININMELEYYTCYYSYRNKHKLKPGMGILFLLLLSFWSEYCFYSDRWSRPTPTTTTSTLHTTSAASRRPGQCHSRRCLGW